MSIALSESRRGQLLADTSRWVRPDSGRRSSFVGVRLSAVVSVVVGRTIDASSAHDLVCVRFPDSDSLCCEAAWECHSELRLDVPCR